MLNANVMRKEWETLMPYVEDSDVALVKIPRFWGPVWAVVPRSCEDISWWATFVQSHDDIEGLGGGGSGRPSLQGPGFIGECSMLMLEPSALLQDGALRNATMEIISEVVGVPVNQVSTTLHEFRRRDFESEATLRAEPVYRAPSEPPGPGGVLLRYGVALLAPLPEHRAVAGRLAGLLAALRAALRCTGAAPAAYNVTVLSCAPHLWIPAKKPLAPSPPMLEPLPISAAKEPTASPTPVPMRAESPVSQALTFLPHVPPPSTTSIPSPGQSSTRVNESVGAANLADDVDATDVAGDVAQTAGWDALEISGSAKDAAAEGKENHLAEKKIQAVDDVILKANLPPAQAMKAAAMAMKRVGGSMEEVEEAVLHSIRVSDISGSTYAADAKAAAEAVKQMGGTPQEATKAAVDFIVAATNADGPDPAAAAAVAMNIAQQMGSSAFEAAIAAGDTAHAVALAGGRTGAEAQQLGLQMWEAAGRRLSGAPFPVWEAALGNPLAGTPPAGTLPAFTPSAGVVSFGAAVPGGATSAGPYITPPLGYAPGAVPPAWANNYTAMMHAVAAASAWVSEALPAGDGVPPYYNPIRPSEAPTSAPTEVIIFDVYNASSEGETKFDLLSWRDYQKINWKRLFHAIFFFTGKHHKYVHDLSIERCGTSIIFEQTKAIQRYLSMITVGKVFQTGTPSVAALIDKRVRGYSPLLCGLFVSMVLKYLPKAIDVCTGSCGPQLPYAQLWSKSRTRCDRLLESCMMHSMSVIFTLVMQIALTTMFFVFWRRDHFVVAYMPEVGLVVFFASLMFISVASVCDRCTGFLLRRTDKEVCLFWLLWALWMAIITVPMLGFSVFGMHFLFEVYRAGWLDEMDYLSPENSLWLRGTHRSQLLCSLSVACWT